MKPTGLTFRLIEYLKRTGRWDSVRELARELGATERAVRSLEGQGVLERYGLLHEHKYHFREMSGEIAPQYERWLEVRSERANRYINPST